MKLVFLLGACMLLGFSTAFAISQDYLIASLLLYPAGIAGILAVMYRKEL